MTHKREKMRSKVNLLLEIDELTKRLDKAKEELSELERESLLRKMPPLGSVMVSGSKEGILTGLERKHNNWRPVISHIKKDGTASKLKHYVYRIEEWELKEVKI